MSDRQALLDAIRDQPDEDTPRLIFADWCDENGAGDRAEFIRVQCALERECSHELRLRQLDLLAGCEREWLGEWADRLVRWTFRRGFLHEVVFTPAAFLDAAELFQREPIWGVSFCAEDGDTIDPAAAWGLVRAPHFAHIRALHVTMNRPSEFAYSMYCGGHPGGAFCAGLTRAPHVTRLRELDLSAGLRSGSGVHHSALHFANAPHLSGLRALRLCGEADDVDALLPALARAPFAPNLERLDLGQQPSAQAWDTAIGKRWFPKLRACQHERVGNRNAAHRIKEGEPVRGNPEAFYQVWLEWVEDADVRAVAEAAELSGATSLLLVTRSLTKGTADALARAPAFRHLERLHAWSVREGAVEGFMRFLQPGVWPRLRDVVIGSGSPLELIAAFGRRFGPRLRVAADC